MPADQLATLLKVSTALASTLELPVVLQTAIESAVSVIGLDTGAIYLLDEEGLYLGATTPPLPPDFPEEYRLARVSDHPHIGMCLDTGDPVYLTDATTAELTPAERGISEARGLRSILYIPLLVEGKAVGSVIVGSTSGVREFNDTEMDVCRTLSYQMALAVANARLFASVREANAEISVLNDNLEAMVDQRTAELAGANADLQGQAEKLRTQAAVLEERTLRLAEASAAKTRFLQSMSHELRTPLNSIIGFSSVMLQGLTGGVSDEQRRQLEMINNSGSHLLALVSDILDLARIEAHELHLSFSPIDIDELVRDSVATVSAAAESKGLELVTRVSEPISTFISDPMRVRQILVNLLGNAVKFTDAGSVILAVRPFGDHAMEFSVKDTGRGIPEELGEEVFREFVQGDERSSTIQEGTGLGLAISRELASALGGTLTLESVPGDGSTLTLTLPLTAMA